jgi:hypothetical protein
VKIGKTLIIQSDYKPRFVITVDYVTGSLVQRLAVMYLGGKYFACRHCYRLAYRSQRETDDDRASRKADKIRDKLKWDRGILNTMGGKPKGMHWKTYYRTWRKYLEVSDQVLLGISKRLGIVNDRLSSLSFRK